MARPTGGPELRPSSSLAKSPLTLPLILLTLPATLTGLLLWPLLALGSLVPVIGLISLTSLLSCTVFLYVAIPTSLHLLFSQDDSTGKRRRRFIPVTLPRLSLFTPSLVTPIHLTHSFLLLVYDAYHSSLLPLFFDSISKRILILGGSNSSEILKENVVYLAASPRSKRLDVYYPDQLTQTRREPTEEGGEDAERELRPVILLIASPSYRHLSSKSFPSSQIALRLRRLGYCVVVPSLTSYPDGSTQDMVHDIRQVLKWISQEVSAFQGDKKRVWILGQGVGASLTLLTVVQSAVVVCRDRELERRREMEQARRRKEEVVGRDRGSSDEDEEERYEEELSYDPFLAERSKNHSRNPSSAAIYEGHYFRSTTHKRPTSVTTVPYSDYNEDHDDDAEPDVEGFDPLPFPPGVNACKIFRARLQDGAETDTGLVGEPEDHGETISHFDELRVRGMILVGGSYDLVKQVKRETELGLNHISALPRVCGTSKIDVELNSPSHLLYAASSLLSCQTQSLPILPNRFLLIHGGKDRIVPYTQSVLLKNLLTGIGIRSERVRLRLYRQESGIGSLTSLMHPTKYSPLVLDEIERMMCSDLLDNVEEEDEGLRDTHEKRKRLRREQKRT